MSSQSQAAAAAQPDESGTALADRLLAQLDTPRSGPLAEFARAYVRRGPAALVQEVEVPDLAAQVASAFEFMSSRSPGQLAVRVYRPDRERDGYGCPGSVVEVNVEDQPFLVDTVTAEMHAHGLGVRLVVHPVIGVERDESGAVTAVTPARGAPHRESVMHFETDRALTEPEAEQLEAGLRRVLGELALAVRDFLPMVDRVERMMEVAGAAGGRYSRDEIQESVAFLQWLTDDNFIYLGYREYEITGEGDDGLLRTIPDSGLGILSDASRSGFAQGVRMGDLRPSIRLGWRTARWC